MLWKPPFLPPLLPPLDLLLPPDLPPLPWEAEALAEAEGTSSSVGARLHPRRTPDASGSPGESSPVQGGPHRPARIFPLCQHQIARSS